MTAKRSKTAILALLLAAAPTTAAATVISLEPIPTMLVATDDPTGYPDPICSKCKIIVVEDEDSAGERADVHIAYPGDGPEFVGYIGLTVWLDTNEPRTMWLSNVSLAPNTEVELVAEANADWSWDEVRFVWLKFVAE
jgi:hypothetical protein